MKVGTQVFRLVVAALLGACGARAPAAPAAVPRDGSTEVVLDNHLPSGFRIQRVTMTLDGDEVAAVPIGTAERSSLFHARIAEGDHTLQIVAEVTVPCGLGGGASERLTARVARSFEVGSAGGLVHLDAFGEGAWLAPAERLHLLVSLRGLGEGRWRYGRSKEGRAACGRLDHEQRSRCVVERLVERARLRNDVAGLLCQKDKLEQIEEAIADLDRRDHHQPIESRTPDGRPLAPERLDARIEALEHEAELCVAEDLGWMGEPSVTSDRSACSRYDEPN